MNNTATTRLADLALVLMGQSPPSSSCIEEGEGMPFVQGNAEFGDRNPTPRLRCRLPIRIAEAGDLLLSVRAPVGEINQAAERTVIGRGLAAIRFAQDDRAFAWHALKWCAGNLNRVAQGSTFVAVSRQDVEDLRIPWQGSSNAAVATVLDCIEEAIGSTVSCIAKLQLVYAGLQHDLLSQGLDQDGVLRNPIAHPEQFTSSQLGTIPKGWRVAPLSYFIASAEYGISTSLSTEGTLPVLRMNNLAGGEASLGDVKYATVVVAESLLLRHGDVLFNRTNSFDHVGRTGIWRGQLPRATFASYLVRLNPIPTRMTNEFLNILLNAPEVQQRMRRFATPAVQQVNISPSNLQKMLIAAPETISEQNRIASRVLDARADIESRVRELAKLRNLQSGLTVDLLTGRVRVPKDRKIEAVA
jgi:type I restriction enzyme, S subunit